MGFGSTRHKSFSKASKASPPGQRTDELIRKRFAPSEVEVSDMFRKGFVLALVGILALPVSAVADPKSPSSTPKSSSSSTSSSTSSTKKKVIWTVIGASAGFAAGVFLGLSKFDDAINSDRKVWLSAMAGAAAGGVAGALIGRQNVGRDVQVERGATPEHADSLGITWESALGKAPRTP
jgi:hypothetical protein